MGKHSNVILTNQEEKIIDSMRHIDSRNSYREILPSRIYVFPKSDKLDFEQIKDFNVFNEKISNTEEQDLAKAISSTFTGISFSFAESAVKNRTKEQIYNYMKNLIQNSSNSKFMPIYKNDKISDYVLQYAEQKHNDFELNFFIDDFYFERETRENFNNYKNNISRIVNETAKKYTKRLENMNSKLLECKDMDKYKIYGELITANLYRLSNEHSNSIQLENYYDNNNLITIPLDVKYAPNMNARRYFKKYSKLKNAFKIVSEQKLETEKEIDYIAEILKSEVMICDKDIKISYNKVLTKAEAKIKVMYLTEDNRIGIAEGKIPIVGFIDIPNVTDGNICNSNYEIKNIVMKPNSTEEHSIYVEMEVQVKCMVYEEKQINLIQDMYSPCEKLSFTKKQITTMINIRKIQETQKVKEIVSVNDIENKKLIDADVKAEVSNTGRMSDSKTYDGELTCNFTFLDDNMNVELKTVKIPFEHSFNDISENCNSNFDLQVTNQDFIVQDGGNISCNIDMLANGTISENKTLNIIDDVQSEDDDDNAEDYSVVVYIVKKGDTLWNIAKRFRTTVDFIVRTNGIENPDVIDVGQKLYIPRYSKMSVNYA